MSGRALSRRLSAPAEEPTVAPESEGGGATLGGRLISLGPALGSKWRKDGRSTGAGTPSTRVVRGNNGTVILTGGVGGRLAAISRATFLLRLLLHLSCPFGSFSLSTAVQEG